MKSRVINRTREQQAHWDSIIPPKKKYYTMRPRRKKYEHIDPVLSMTEEEKCLFYIRNCNWWIHEFKEGRTDESKLRSALNSLYTLYVQLRTIKQKSRNRLNQKV